MEEGYNFAFPYLREGTGVDPREDDYSFARLLTSQMPKNTTLETAPPPPQEQAPPTSQMQGTGFDQKVEEKSDVKPSSSSAITDNNDEELTAEEKQALKKKIESVREKVSQGQLVVKSFGIGKRKSQADSSDLDEALEEEGYGKKARKKKANKIADIFSFD